MHPSSSSCGCPSNHGSWSYQSHSPVSYTQAIQHFQHCSNVQPRPTLTSAWPILCNSQQLSTTMPTRSIAAVPLASSDLAPANVRLQEIEMEDRIPTWRCHDSCVDQPVFQVSTGCLQTALETALTCRYWSMSLSTFNSTLTSMRKVEPTRNESRLGRR